jgi:hypothetical protein
MGLLTRPGITGVITNRKLARLPKASGLTTEYSTPAWILVGTPPIAIVFAAKSPTGTFHLFPEDALSL